MNAIQNMNSYMASNDKLKNLELIQKQVQSELDMVPEKESKHFDPFAQPKKAEKKRTSKKEKVSDAVQEEPSSFLNDPMFVSKML